MEYLIFVGITMISLTSYHIFKYKSLKKLPTNYYGKSDDFTDYLLTLNILVGFIVGLSIIILTVISLGGIVWAGGNIIRIILNH